MAEKKQAKQEPGTVEWEEERTRLSGEVKKAQQALWDHSHPVIEDPQAVAQQEYKAQQAAEQKKAAKK